MSCANDKKLPTRAERFSPDLSPKELASLIQMQTRATRKISQVLKDSPKVVFRIFIQGFG